MTLASIPVKFLSDCSWLTHGNWLWLQEQLFHVVAEDRLIAARARSVANLLEGDDFALDTSRAGSAGGCSDWDVLLLSWSLSAEFWSMFCVGGPVRCVLLFGDYRIVLLVVVYSCRQAAGVSEMMCVSARLLSAVHREARVDACVHFVVIAV